MKKPTGYSLRNILWVAAGLALAAVAVALLIPAHDWTQMLESFLEERNLAMALLIFCAAYVVGTLLMIPAWIFPIAAGAAFGPAWGFVAALASSTIAALAAYLITRHLARARVERAAKRIDTFQAVDKAVRREPFKMVALLRMSPVLPSGLKSYFLGLTCVKPLVYVLATALGMAPGIALKVYVGHAGRGAFGSGGATKWALLAAGVAATLALTYVVTRAARKRLGI